MIGVRRHAPLLSTCGVLVAVAAFLSSRIIFSNPPIFVIDAGPCREATEAGDLLPIAGLLWLAAWVLGAASVVLGFATRRVSPVLTGMIALGIAFLNFANLLSGGRLPWEPFSVATLRSINTAEVTYLSISGGAYGNIPDLVRHDLVDPQLEQPASRNYAFKLVLRPEGYVATASPTGPHGAAEGCWEYFSMEDAVIHYSKDPKLAPPGLAGSPLDR